MRRAAEEHSVGSHELTLVRQLGNAGKLLDWKAELTLTTVQPVDVGKLDASSKISINLEFRTPNIYRQVTIGVPYASSV